MDSSDSILDFLQLYEFSMVIGTSLDYQTNCDQFLTVLLARKNLSACCILKRNNSNYEKIYSYPLSTDKRRYVQENDFILSCFADQNPKTGILDQSIDCTSDFIPERSTWIFFSLKSDVGLFLFDFKGKVFSMLEINKLFPIINKFSLSLEACESFSKQQELLNKITIQNRELREYTHVISHDLKSPLRNINTLMEWTKEDIPEPCKVLSTNFKGIDENIKKMDDMINALITYSEIDQRTNIMEEINVSNFLQELIESLKPENHISFTIKSNMHSLFINKFRFKKLLGNIISNAIASIDKSKGMITITLDKKQGRSLLCSIQDNGRGIDKKYQDKIFEIFQTLDEDKKTMGVGLSIVKKIVDLYNGSICFESEPGVGTTFFLTLKI